MNYQVGAASLIGAREENQDFFKYAETALGLLAVVCDGMGGVSGGKEAAELAVIKIFDEVSHLSEKDPARRIVKAISKANLSIFKESIKNPWLNGMGTTVAVLLITEDSAFCFHLGDSRIYQFRGVKTLYRTLDHSRVFEMVNQGLLSEEEARVSPMSNIITKVLGTEPVIEVSTSPALSYLKGDRFLLCTDGIWGSLPGPELTELISLQKPVEEVVEKLTSFIGNSGKAEGARHDNMTAVLIEIL